MSNTHTVGLYVIQYTKDIRCQHTAESSRKNYGTMESYGLTGKQHLSIKNVLKPTKVLCWKTSHTVSAKVDPGLSSFASHCVLAPLRTPLYPVGIPCAATKI